MAAAGPPLSSPFKMAAASREARRRPSTKMAAPPQLSPRRARLPGPSHCSGVVVRKKMSASSPSGPGGAEPQRGPPTPGLRRQWELHRAGAPAGLAAGAGVGAARRGLKVRNALTALGIGAVVVGIYAYTIHSISQERFLDELERDAKVLQTQRAKASAE